MPLGRLLVFTSGQIHPNRHSLGKKVILASGVTVEDVGDVAFWTGWGNAETEGMLMREAKMT